METGTGTCDHGSPVGNCLACEMDQGQRIAEKIAALMKQEGLTDPGEQFGTLLGLGVAGFARAGTELELLLEAVRQAYERAKL